MIRRAHGPCACFEIRGFSSWLADEQMESSEDREGDVLSKANFSVA